MGLPALQKTWNISACNRIPYVSLNDTMANLLFGVKEFLKSHGYTVRGSSDGVTGGMDGVDRWDTASKAAIRGASATTPMSWIVLRDQNPRTLGADGVDILFAYQGASDDIARISISSTAEYAVAGTATHRPATPANTECVAAENASLISSATSGDRLWSCWVSSDARAFRVAVARGNIWVGMLWGVEDLASSVISPAQFDPAVWAWGYSSANTGFATVVAGHSTQRGGQARVVVSSIPYIVNVGGTHESLENTSVNYANYNLELQGSQGVPMFPLGCATLNSVGARGKLGDRFDWWTGRTAVGTADGDTYGSLEFIQLGHIVWPWDEITTPVMS